MQAALVRRNPRQMFARCTVQVRAASGASGALLLLDFQQEQLCVAEVGPYHHAVLGRLYGGMAVQRAEAQVLGQAEGVDQHGSCLGMGRRKVRALAGELKWWGCPGATSMELGDVVCLCNPSRCQAIS